MLRTACRQSQTTGQQQGSPSPKVVASLGDAHQPALFGDIAATMRGETWAALTVQVTVRSYGGSPSQLTTRMTAVWPAPDSV